MWRAGLVGSLLGLVLVAVIFAFVPERVGGLAAGAWVCDQAPVMRFKGVVQGQGAGVAGGAPVPLVAAATFDADGLYLWVEGWAEPGYIPWDHVAGWNYTSGTVVGFTPVYGQLFAHDSDGDGRGDRLKVYMVHDRGHDFDQPGRAEPERDVYIVDTGCRFGTP